MDISAATTLAAGIVALIAPALVQAFKKYIPADYGVAQAVYTLVNQAFSGKLSKDEPQE